MDYSLIKDSTVPSRIPEKEYVIDTRADVAKLPTDVMWGSVCFCIEDSSAWMINSSKVWVQI